MAETITGCVDWTTGAIKFDNEDCTYWGCMIWTGVHAGQVKVVLDESNETNMDCWDTYYGCVNWTTGRFEIQIPDGCCTPWENPLISPPPGCEHCESGKTPKYISVRFHNMQQCTNCMNGVGSVKMLVDVDAIQDKWWVLENDGFFYSGDYCNWVAPYQEGEAIPHAFVGSFGQKQGWNDLNCPGTPDATCSFNRMALGVGRGVDYISFGISWVFNDYYTAGCSGVIFYHTTPYCDVSGCANCFHCPCDEVEEECVTINVQLSTSIWAEIREGRPSS